MTKHEENIMYPESIKKAVDNLEVFFETDMWYSKGAEWKTEKDMLHYLRMHFKILEQEIIRLIGKEKYEEKK